MQLLGFDVLAWSRIKYFDIFCAFRFSVHTVSVKFSVSPNDLKSLYAH